MGDEEKQIAFEIAFEDCSVCGVPTAYNANKEKPETITCQRCEQKIGRTEEE